MAGYSGNRGIDEIKRHYHFVNALKKRMFSEVGHSKTFSLNIYAGKEDDIRFDHAASLLLPSMIDESYEHDGVGPVIGLKSYDGSWNIRGHKKRIVDIDINVLRDFASVIEAEGASADNARFLFPFSTETLAVLKTFAGSGSSVSIAGKPYQMRPMWHESSATKRDGIIENKVSFPSSAKEVILNGSLIHVGNPFFKITKPNRQA